MGDVTVAESLRGVGSSCSPRSGLSGGKADWRSTIGKFVLPALVTIACLAVQAGPAAATHRVGDTQRQYQAPTAPLTPPSHAPEWRHPHLKADGRGHELVLKGADEFSIKLTVDGRAVKYRHGAFETGSVNQAHIHAVVLSGEGRECMEYAVDKGSRARLTYRAMFSTEDPPDETVTVVVG